MLQRYSGTPRFRFLTPRLLFLFPSPISLVYRQLRILGECFKYICFDLDRVLIPGDLKLRVSCLDDGKHHHAVKSLLGLKRTLTPPLLPLLSLQKYFLKSTLIPRPRRASRPLPTHPRHPYIIHKREAHCQTTTHSQNTPRCGHM